MSEPEPPRRSIKSMPQKTKKAVDEPKEDGECSDDSDEDERDSVAVDVKLENTALASLTIYEDIKSPECA